MAESLLGSVVWVLELYGWTLYKLEVIRYHNMSSGCDCYNNVLTKIYLYHNLNSKKIIGQYMT